MAKKEERTRDKEEEMIEAVMKIAEDDAPQVKAGFEALFDNIVNKGMMPGDALGVKDTDAESLYAQAYQMYNMGKYKDARNVFMSLTYINPMEPRYIFGHAACSHMLEDYEDAAIMYNNQALIDPEDPVPYYHAADCYIKLGDKFSASVALNLVVQRSGDDPKYAMIKERSELTLKNLEKELETDLKGSPEDIESPRKEKNKEKKT